MNVGVIWSDVSFWTILTIVAVVALTRFWGKNPNPVWVSLMCGFIGGLVAAGIYWYIGHGFLWSFVGKWCVALVVGTFVEEVIRGAWKRYQNWRNSN